MNANAATKQQQQHARKTLHVLTNKMPRRVELVRPTAEYAFWPYYPDDMGKNK